MTFMNKADPADPDPRWWPTWATVLGILLVAGIVALVLLYRAGGKLFGLDDAWARALVFVTLTIYSGIAASLQRRRARMRPQRPS